MRWVIFDLLHCNQTSLLFWFILDLQLAWYIKMRHFNLFILRLLFLTNFLQFNSYACFATKQTNSIQPIVINTWNFKSAGEEAWRVLQKEGSSALDSVQGIYNIWFTQGFFLNFLYNLQVRYLHYWAINRLYPKLVVLNVKLTSVIQQLGLVVVRMKMGK